HAASRLLGWPSRASLPRGPRWLEHGCDLPHLGRGHVAEDVAIPLHDDAPLPGSFWKELGRALGNKPNAGTRGDRTAFLEMLEERAPTRLILLRPLADAENLRVTALVHADRNQQRDIAHLVSPTTFEHNAVEIK